LYLSGFGFFSLLVNVTNSNNLASVVVLFSVLGERFGVAHAASAATDQPMLIRSFAPMTRLEFIFEAALEKAWPAIAAPAPKLPVRFRKSRRSNPSEDMASS
jgi:hypothetical protein